MTNLELLNFLTDQAKSYRKDCVASINRNKHMNKLTTPCDIDQSVVDAVLTDFINRIGSNQGVDYALYSKDLG